MNLKFLLGGVFIGLAFLYGKPAFADQFYIAIQVNCAPKLSTLDVVFKGAWNESGEMMLRSLGKNSWSTWDLVEFAQDANGKYTMQEKKKQVRCQIGSSRYVVDIQSMMAPGFHPEGKCASRMGAKAQVTLNRRIIAEAGLDGCTENGNVTTSMTIAPGKAVAKTEVPAEKFYYQD